MSSIMREWRPEPILSSLGVIFANRHCHDLELAISQARHEGSTDQYRADLVSDFIASLLSVDELVSGKILSNGERAGWRLHAGGKRFFFNENADLHSASIAIIDMEIPETAVIRLCDEQPPIRRLMDGMPDLLPFFVCDHVKIVCASQSRARHWADNREINVIDLDVTY